MKKTPLQSLCLALALFTLAATQRAGAIAYQIDGYLVVNNAPFSALWTFDETVPDAFPGEEGFRLGQYESPTTFQFSVNGNMVMEYAGSAFIWVHPGHALFAAAGYSEPVITPWGNLLGEFHLGLVDPTGQALDSDALAHAFEKFDLSDVDQHGLTVGGYGNDGTPVFGMGGKITAISRVPDAGATALLLAMGVAGICGLKRFVHKAPPPPGRFPR